MMTDADLMKRIHERYGPLLDSVAQSSSARPEFLAALIANESGGDPDATRFEPAVFAALGEVLLGQKAAYGSIGAQDLLLWAVPGALPANGAGNAAADADAADAARRGFANQVQRLGSLATSYGLTQVMGYEAIAFHTHGVEALRQPLSSLVITSRLLAQFASRFGLDLAKDFAELFDCWNTGRPHAPTADPQYVPRGLARLQLYQNILASMGSAT
jgi:hypothetical protein